MESNLKRRLSETEESEVTKFKRIKMDELCANAALKSSIQIVYEIKQVQPIKFEMVSSQGPAHKPLFTFKLVFNYTDTDRLKEFCGEGYSKKNAKIMASIRGMHYLVHNQTYFSTNDQEFLKSIMQIDFKSLNLTSSFEECLVQVKEIDNSGPPENISIEEVKIEPKQPDEVGTPPVKQSEVKTRELIASKNVLSIFNHLFASSSFSFSEITQSTALSHSNMFKIELKLVKNKNLTADVNKFASLSETSCKMIAKESSLLINETEEEFSFIGFGNSKKLARTRCAQLALKTILNLSIDDKDQSMDGVETAASDNLNSGGIKEFADNISELVKHKYYRLMNLLDATAKSKSGSEDSELTSQSKLRNVYAGIVQSDGFDSNSAKLICITTGTKCISGQFMSQCGVSLNDCHAEILAVRLLRKYFYKQLNLTLECMQNQVLTDESLIFEDVCRLINPDGQQVQKRFRLKENIKFSLFISSAPCGDGRIFAINDNVADDEFTKDSHPNRKVRGLLRTKLESGEGTVPVNNVVTLQTWDGVLIGERLKVMSCSDKLCKYKLTVYSISYKVYFVT